TCQKQWLRSTKQCLASSPSEKRRAAAGGSWRHNPKLLEFTRTIASGLVPAGHIKSGGHSLRLQPSRLPIPGLKERGFSADLSSTQRNHAAAVAASCSSVAPSSRQVSARKAWPRKA